MKTPMKDLSERIETMNADVLVEWLKKNMAHLIQKEKRLVMAAYSKDRLTEIAGDYKNHIELIKKAETYYTEIFNKN